MGPEHAADSDASLAAGSAAPGDAAPAAGVPDNYRYWQEHGGTWSDEYDRRKRHVAMYHIQEVMLVEYFMHHAPARVFEFGCGVGRHLRNLARIPGLDVYGYDQSPTMIAGCARWASQAWIDEHIRLGPPVGRLPYPDGAFDVVYTAEVLVHVRPGDLETILRELVRVCRGHMLHIEPSEHVSIASAEHAGCWKHDLVAAYDRIGHKCERLPSGYFDHAPVRVAIDAGAVRYTWSPVTLALFRRMEEDLKGALQAGRQCDEIAARCRELDGALSAVRGRADQVESELAASRHALAQTRAALTALEQSTADRIVAAQAQVDELRAALDMQVRASREQSADLAEKRDLDRRHAAQVSAQHAWLVRQLREVLGT